MGLIGCFRLLPQKTKKNRIMQQVKNLYKEIKSVSTDKL